jgi:hypothetical protein
MRAIDWRAAGVAAVSGALIALGTYAVSHRPTLGQQDAQAIEQGMATTQPTIADAEALEDERLTGDANEAGYRWAERRSIDNPVRCPTYSKAFHEGCAAYVADQYGGR